jgi:hypothetical protein
MWKEVVVVHFEVLSGGTEENYVNLSQDSQWRVSSSGIWCRVVRWVAPDVSGERIASIFRVEE